MPLSFSIVTPSFNQAPFIDATIRSVLDQRAPHLDYRVLDGGSSDDSAEIIRSHAPRLAGWRSAPDGGMYSAIQEGFCESTGEIMAWLNSDDLYFPWTLQVVADVFSQCPEVEWLTSLHPVTLGSNGTPVQCDEVRGYSRAGFMDGENLGGGSHYAPHFIQQESTFWRRSLWERAGASFNKNYRLAGDFDLWARFFKCAPLAGVPVPLAGFRVHGSQQSQVQFARYFAEASAALRVHGGKTGPGWQGAMRKVTTRLPRSARGVLQRLGLVHPALNCKNDLSGKWRTEWTPT